MKISSILVALLASASLALAADAPAKPKKPVDKAAQFAKMDADKDGKVTKDEFLASAKDDAAKAKKADQFAKLDKDKDGSLTLDEFKAPPAPKKPK
jgi:hypothetical protein